MWLVFFHIDDPPLVFVLKVIQQKKNTSQLARIPEIASTQDPVNSIDRCCSVWIQPSSFTEYDDQSRVAHRYQQFRSGILASPQICQANNDQNDRAASGAAWRVVDQWIGFPAPRARRYEP